MSGGEHQPDCAWVSSSGMPRGCVYHVAHQRLYLNTESNTTTSCSDGLWCIYAKVSHIDMIASTPEFVLTTSGHCMQSQYYPIQWYPFYSPTEEDVDACTGAWTALQLQLQAPYENYAGGLAMVRAMTRNIIADAPSGCTVSPTSLDLNVVNLYSHNHGGSCSPTQLCICRKAVPRYGPASSPSSPPALPPSPPPTAPLQVACCAAMIKECLACQQGLSVLAFCEFANHSTYCDSNDTIVASPLVPPPPMAPPTSPPPPLVYVIVRSIVQQVEVEEWAAMGAATLLVLVALLQGVRVFWKR